VRLQGAAAIVTGGASGIGAATVLQLQDAGARVVVLDCNPDHPTAEHVVACDVADEEQVASAVREAVEVLDGLDVAVLAAGIGGISPVRQLDLAQWDRIHAVNTRGAAVCLRECANAMISSGRHCAIVAVTSISGFLADRGLAPYAASKAALAEVVRIAARELGPHGIRVNAVAPGTTETPMFAATDRNPGYRERVVARTPLGQVGPADGVAQAIVAIAQLDWVTGQILAADGGVSLFSPIDPFPDGPTGH
jgi:NAD(P)-dependent dehydrogenase (short-subunit alcohol dehydrogenase family)